jgi:hypothetical protein
MPPVQQRPAAILVAWLCLHGCGRVGYEILSDAGPIGMSDAGSMDASAIGVDARIPDASAVDARSPTEVWTGIAELEPVGDATLGSTLVLHDGPWANAGAAWFPTPVSTGASLSVFYELRIDSPDSSPAFRADGMAFCIQSNALGTAAVGGTGGNLGIPAPSVCVEQDIFLNPYDAADNELSIVRNVASDHLATARVTPDFVSAQSRFVWVEYDRASRAMRAYYAATASRPATPAVAATVDLAAWLGPTAWLGFTASSSGTALYFAILDVRVEIRE